MNSSDSHLFKLTTVLFNAALGSHYYQEFSGVLEQIGIDALAQNWGASDVAKEVLGITPELQAKALTAHFGLDPNSTDMASAGYIAHEFFLTNLQAGMNVGSLSLAAVRYFEQDDILPVLEDTRTYLNNRAEVAYQYSTELALGGPTISTLQQAITDVSHDPDSVSKTLRDIVKNEFDLLRVDSTFTEYTDNDDIIIGTDGPDFINAGAGYDTVEAGDGADMIIGGTGDDILKGERGQDWIEGGDGADQIYAGTYYDSNYVNGHYDANGNYVDGFYTYTIDAYFEVLNGGSGADKIYGGYGSDTIDGGDGADTIYGDGNNYYSSNHFENVSDSIKARLFNDTINGGEGDDRIYAEYGSDTIRGGAGDDQITLNKSNSNKSEFDGRNTAYGEEGNDSIYAVGNDYVDGGVGNDTINFYRTDVSSEHGVIIAGEGEDTIRISNNYSSKTSSNLTIDLSEDNQVADSVYIGVADRITSIVEIKGFDLDADLLELSEYFDLYSSEDEYIGRTHSAQQKSYSGDVLKNYSQITDSESTPWLHHNYPEGRTPEDYGKAYFVIQGAKANSASTTDVAALIDRYGNDAAYGKSDSHLFLVNVSDTDMGVYIFTDDTGANNRIVSDELTPVAVLTGITTADVTYNNVDFLI